MKEHDTRKAAEVMIAFADGEPVQIRRRNTQSNWLTFRSSDRCHNDPVWNWDSYEYRIKPEPREWWVNAYKGSGTEPDGIVSIIHSSREVADQQANCTRIECVHVREVID